MVTVAMEDNESCGSGIHHRTSSSSSIPGQSRHHRQKLEVYNEILRRLNDSGNEEAMQPGFSDQLWAHFNRLPSRYALDVNVERAEDVLMHKRLLHLAHDPANRPQIEIRLVQLHSTSDENTAESFQSYAPGEDSVQSSSKYSSRQGIHPPPAFGSSPNLEALALEENDSDGLEEERSLHDSEQYTRPMHEITFSTDDKPKLLSQLTALLAEVGLNIQEAHAFSTNDGYSLDVFVVEGWPYEETEKLKETLEKEVLKIERHERSSQQSRSSVDERDEASMKHELDRLTIPNDGTDVWEIDPKHLKYGTQIASASYGELFKGTYCSQEVAIKVLKAEHVSSEMQKEFAQEVYIMRKVRHKNVVQFMGACTKPPRLCIVTEFMSGGSVYDYLHKQKGFFKFPTLLKVAIDISKGMNYLHQHNIIHRDLKTANLLMDENGLPYEYLTPLQAAIGVVQKGLRPTIPKGTNAKFVQILERSWQQDPTLRPDFSEITEILQQLAKEVGDEGEGRKDKSGGFLSALRRGHH
ncbi:hypothetical protein TSUD_51680 [Trifolium subterraneum]|uniref:non-specific serine/threonine protein kinase n=1 Tax=Trifolium subterraneum TaxID=3900 RepID=A0A2Z6MIC4_TRISU|nr:hypothetical protein TSUD_51680 [Trifolium subterraneum]